MKPKQQKTARRLLSLVALLLLAALCTSCGLLDLTNGYVNTPSTTTGSRVQTVTPSGTGSVNVDQYKSPEIPADAGTYAYVARVASPSVVSITTEQTVYSSYGKAYVESGAGSGVILFTDVAGGYTYIITNNHVVEGCSTITVYLNGESEGRPAVLCGGDWQSDVAVVRIDGTDFTTATLGNSTELLLGQEVAAIGNPLGRLGGTVTDGIIGCLARTIVLGGVPMTLIQHSAGVSPGNSGGGLFNLYGQLIGIVNAKTSATGVEGIGYAIPINLALERATQIIENGYVAGTPDLGLGYGQESTDGILSGIPDGILITSYQYNAELEAANQNPLKEGDMLRSLNGYSVTSVAAVRRVLTTVKAGDVITATFARRVAVNVGIYQTYTWKDFTVNLTVHEYLPSGATAAPEDTPNEGDMEFN